MLLMYSQQLVRASVIRDNVNIQCPCGTAQGGQNGNDFNAEADVSWPLLKNKTFCGS